MTVTSFLSKFGEKVSKDEITTLSGSLAYYTALSLAPLIVTVRVDSTFAPLLVAKLLLLPLVMAGVVVAFGLWPWPGAILIVSAGAPTAVNTLLLAIEQKGDVEFAADCVFWTTLLSAVSVTLVLAAVKALGGVP